MHTSDRVVLKEIHRFPFSGDQDAFRRHLSDHLEELRSAVPRHDRHSSLRVEREGESPVYEEGGCVVLRVVLPRGHEIMRFRVEGGHVSCLANFPPNYGEAAGALAAAVYDVVHPRQPRMVEAGRKFAHLLRE